MTAVSSCVGDNYNINKIPLHLSTRNTRLWLTGFTQIVIVFSQVFNRDALKVKIFKDKYTKHFLFLQTNQSSVTVFFATDCIHSQ